MTAEPALLERRATALLPNGSRLVARLQSAVSTAVKAPVVAAIEYNYERDGEIIIPAGAKAFGELQQANRNGNVGIHFHTLQMPDGTTEKIDAGSMSLTYGPLKGSVSGGNTVKRILVRSMTGVGTMAAYPGRRAGWFWRGQRPARQQHLVARAHRVECRARRGAGDAEPCLQREHRGFGARKHAGSSLYCWRGAGRSRPPEQPRQAPAT